MKRITRKRSKEIKILSLFTPIVGRTEEEALVKYEDYKKYISYEGALPYWVDGRELISPYMTQITKLNT